MDTRRLHLLLTLARLGSMREVADTLGTTTSTVSQQLATLAKETGATLLEPDGRRVRLTPAGRRLADHAVTILAAVDAAHRDLDTTATPAGTVRIAGFATAIRHHLLPMTTTLAGHHPDVRLLIREHEPHEALHLLRTDQTDLALTYDYNLAPAPITDPALDSTHLWTRPWALATGTGNGRTTIADHAGHDWIVNSRNTADEQVLHTLTAIAGHTATITHRADSLDLVQDLITAGLGAALLPHDHPTRPGVTLHPLTDPPVRMRAHAITRRGAHTWPPLALVLRLLGQSALAPSLFQL